MNLSGLLDLVRQHDMYRALLDDLPVTDRRGLSLGLIRSARPCVVAALALDVAAPTLVITARIDRVHNLAEQLLAWSPDLRVLTYAEPNPIFYEHTPWGTEAIRARLQVLAELADESKPGTVIVTSARALMQRTIPHEVLTAQSITLTRDAPIPQPDLLLRRWVEAGYEPVSIVTEPGTYSRRGGIIDIFPVAEEQPVRIELWGNSIESLRAFDPTTQRSRESYSSVTVTPAREGMPLYSPQVATALESWFVARSTRSNSDGELLADREHLRQGLAFPAIEFYLPWMYTEHASLLEYLPNRALVLVDDWDDLAETVADLEAQALSLRGVNEQAGNIPPEMPLPLITWDQLSDELAHAGVIELAGTPDHSEPIGDLFTPGARYGGQIKAIFDHLKAETRAEYDRGIVVSRQAGRLVELWHERQHGTKITTTESMLTIPPSGSLTFIQGTLAEGWVLHDELFDTHLFTDAEIFGWSRPEPRRRPRRRAIAPEDFFADLSPGDFVVHVEYGVGRFQGLEKRSLGGVEREYLLLTYAGGDNLYVPIHQADRLSRYIGADDSPPPLSRLGTLEWSRVKERTRQAVEETARELLDLYAAREMVTGHAFSPDTSWQHELEASFPYVETDDQLRALTEVKHDMEQPRPMDRLICGDVGYGKTEVALRAAFKAVMDGKQVAILVPTTILAQQHYETFTRRLVPFPVEVEMLSRFRTLAEQRRIIDRLIAGQTDIVIGTHRLLSQDVSFKDLGLLVIDEEQRFGVTHKERLKQMRTEMDVLTMTATPIPRTLYMSLTGVRDISTIDTPPEERIPIVTHVGRRDDDLIRRSILRELDRGGQVFYVHNRVQTIYTEEARLKRIVPEASIAVGHGQMSEAQLEAIMNQFASGRIDVLMSTSIIEAGLDIPNANTLIVDRADWFGLAQLYQLRGRVGRGANQAFAYFFHPPYHSLTAEARARLETIAEQTELGAGFNIAMHDLEIRGAGDILGTRQHGHISAVGFHLYTRMLGEAVKRLRAEREGAVPVRSDGKPKEDARTREVVTIDLPLPTYIPTDYVSETSLRIQLYRRLAEVDNEQAITALAEELSDRFGPLPPPVNNLLYQLHVKLLALRANVDAVTTENGQVSIRVPGLAHVDRQLLQHHLGHNVRVSRTAVWLPRSENDRQDGYDWRAALLEVLGRLANEMPTPQANGV